MATIVDVSTNLDERECPLTWIPGLARRLANSGNAGNHLISPGSPSGFGASAGRSRL